jgi:sugar phosphate isomerase/epimerase
MKYAVCSEIFQGWSMDKAMAYARKAGYDGFEISPFTIAKYVTEIPAVERRRLREVASGLGLEITGLHWVLAQTEGLYMNHPEAAIRARTSQYFCDLVDCCADLGGHTIVVGSPKQRNIMDGVTPAQAWDWATECFKPAVACAEARQVTFCMEPLAPVETNFLNRAEDAIRFARQFNSPAMKIILDVKAMCSESKPIPQIIRESKGEFGYFHANDQNLKGPGFGDVDFQPIAAALREVGYDGWMSVEVFKFEEGPEVIATQSLEYLKRVVG